MSIGAAIYSRLTGHGGTDALVDGRVYPTKLPQDVEMPAIRYQMIDDVPEHAMGSDVGVAHGRVQIDCFGSDYDEARNVATNVHDALSRFNGTAGGVTIQATFAENKGIDFYEHEVEQNRIAQDYMVHYEE